MSKLAEWAKTKTDELTFIQLKPGAALGLKDYRVPEGGLYIPVMTHELADRIQSMPEDKVLTVPSMIRGIMYLIGADHDFIHRKAYEDLVFSLGEEAKVIAHETAEGFERARRFEEAVLIMRGCCQLYPHDYKSMVMLGAFYVRLAGSQDIDHMALENDLMLSALSFLETAYAKLSKDVLLLFYLGSVYFWQKSYYKAEMTWIEAKKQAVHSKHINLINAKLKEVYPFARYEEGYQMVLQGQAVEGLAILKPLLGEKPNWWNLHFFIATAYQQLNDWDHAIHHYGKVLEIKGYHQETALELSDIYLAKGEKAMAVQWMEEILLQQPGDPALLMRMALVKAHVGDMTDAFEYLEAAEDAGASQEVVAEMKQRLSN